MKSRDWLLHICEISLFLNRVQGFLYSLLFVRELLGVLGIGLL